MKKFITPVLAALLLLVTLSGCGKEKAEDKHVSITPLPTSAPTATPSPTATPEHGPSEDDLGILEYTLPDWDYTKEETEDDGFTDGISIETATYAFNQDERMIHIEVLKTEEYNSYTPAHYADMILTANVQDLGEGYILPLLEKYDVYCGVLPSNEGSDMKFVAGYFRVGTNMVVMIEVGLAADDVEVVWDAFEDFLDTVETNEID